jgi:hypothetical protein
MTGIAMQTRSRGKAREQEDAPYIGAEPFSLPRKGAAYSARIASRTSCGRGVRAALWERV